ncbi:FERM, ARHGEF and pleckstrin domain-containing protein 1-like isoform X8 [Brevipalpus obovatus]|uniref:FERM, ARHGEF and pleckstrin domain-containing protein 1-like isoform X8 n=1 Tax=Brevipalpus obovatus TaxID=246614 RepID=UPI003D9DD477
MVKSDLKATVVLPDDNEIVFDVHPRIKGIDLFNSACENLNLLERDYFGLSYQDEAHVRYWLDMDKKLSKIFTTFPLVFFFEMKFYPPDPALLQEDYTRYLLCLQVRNDINNSRLPCSFVTYALLGSYLVQSQLGDFDEQVHGPGTGYLKDFQFAPNPVEGLEDRVIELHKQHRGQTPAEAELHYLETAKKLAMYGVELFPAIDSFGVEIAIGVCASGLSVYKDRLKMNRFAWPKILKISYRRHNFYIKIRPGEFEQVESTIGFKLANRKFAKRLWKTAVEHHTFFRLTDADSPIKSKFLFFRLGSKFRYSGRTQYQSRQSIIARPQPQFTRSLTSIVSRRTSDLRVRPQLGDQRILSSVGLDTTITPPEGPQKGTENQVAPQPDTSLEEETLTKKYKKPVGGVAVLPPMDMKRLEEQRKSPLPPDRPHSRSPGFVNEAYRGSPGPQFTGQDEPTAKSINPRISPTSGYHSSNLIKELATRQQQQAHTRPDTAYHTKRFERNSHGFHSGPDHLNRSRTTPSPGPGTTSVTPDAGGRISRQSGLESSSESPISSSESSLDEYADENTDPLIVKKLTKKSKDNNKQVVSKEFANDYGLPRRSPIPPHVSETSRVLTSQTSTSTTRNYPNKDEDKSYSKMSTVEEKEKTIGTKISETSKIITGNFEDVEALLREEGFDTSKVRVGIEPMPIKTEETQKFSYTTAKDHDDHTASSFIRTDNSSTSWKEKTPSTSTQNRPAERPRDVGDFISSQAVSTKMKTVETLTYKMEKDGVLETRMEQKIVVKSDGESPIDHDRALADAIQQATMMSPDMTVEKIEIKQSDKN